MFCVVSDWVSWMVKCLFVMCELVVVFVIRSVGVVVCMMFLVGLYSILISCWGFM